MEIKDEDVSKEYLEILQKIVNIRIKRRSLYGDSHTEMPAVGHYWHSFNKMKRLRVQLDAENKTGNINTLNYEKIEDNAIDIINYMIFFLIMREKEQNESMEKQIKSILEEKEKK